jgi:hypothetical protein
MKAWWASCLLPDLQAMPATIILISGRRVQLLVPNELPGALDVTGHNVVARIH